MLGGTKQRYIWTANGTLWSIIDSLVGSTIRAEHYGDMFTSTWEIPRTQFDAEFVEAKDLRYMDQVVNNQPTAGFSTRLLRSDYAGAAAQVRRSSDNMNADIGFIDSYSFDVPAFNAHVGAGTGTLRTWYDQFNANNSVQGTNLQQPLITPAAGSNARTSIFYEGNNCRMPANSLAAAFSGIETPFTWLALVRSASLAANRSYFGVGSSTSNNPIIGSRFVNAPFNRFARADDTAAAVNTDDAVPVVNTYYVTGLMWDSPNIYFLWNGVQTKVASAALGQITLNRFTIGALTRMGVVQRWNGDIDEAFVWDHAIGVKDLALASYNMSQFYAVY